MTAWNGLAFRAFAEAAGVLDDERYRTVAVRLAMFMSEQLVDPDGRLLRSWRHGRRGPPGYCDDYAATALGMFATYQVTGDRRWYDEGARLVGSAVDRFADPDGGFFAAEAGDPTLIVRPEEPLRQPHAVRQLADGRGAGRAPRVHRRRRPVGAPRRGRGRRRADRRPAPDRGRPPARRAGLGPGDRPPGGRGRRRRHPPAVGARGVAPLPTRCWCWPPPTGPTRRCPSSTGGRRRARRPPSSAGRWCAISPCAEAEDLARQLDLTV